MQHQDCLYLLLPYLLEVPTLPKRYLIQENLMELAMTFAGSPSKFMEKMTANANQFSNATTILTYIAGCLTSRTYMLILPKTAYEILQFNDYPKLLDYLWKAFGNSDRIQSAQNKIFFLRQKAQEFRIYFSKFQHLTLEGEMPESVLKLLLFQGISYKLQDMLLYS
jgi:hypothetical protein